MTSVTQSVSTAFVWANGIQTDTQAAAIFIRVARKLRSLDLSLIILNSGNWNQSFFNAFINLYYFISAHARKPSHVAHASVVVNVITSTHAAVNVGAVHQAQSTLAGQLTVWLHQFVKIKVKLQAFHDAGGLLKVNVCVAVDTVAVTTFQRVKSISSVHHVVSHKAFTVSE